MNAMEHGTDQSIRGLAAAIPFLASIALLGVAVQSGALLAFAIGWPILQFAAYAVVLRKSEGDLRHPLVTSQIALNWLVLTLQVAIMVRVL